MNRSVINIMIAAGVVSGGAAVGSAPTVADPATPGPVTGTDDTATAQPQDSDGSRRRPLEQNRRGAYRDAGSGQAEDWRCQRKRPCPGRPSKHARSRPNAPLVQAPPFAELESARAGLALDLEVPSFQVPTAPVPALMPPQARPPATATVILSVPIGALPVPIRSGPSASLPTDSPDGTPEAVSTPLPRIGPDPAVPLRLGYPANLPKAGLLDVASLALPGLAALVGMTALGGLLGYRQAKAGYVLRAAGAGRFLQ